ncbi:MAG TPA: ComF family protein [Bacteroidales bacterium]|nr:ComF family protein [Bacteroidales bacterium]HRZ76781.1 ComF family protein [Bacteroidales bacterium]
MFTDLFNLFFPRHCVCCSNSLYRDEEVLCLRCRFHLPATGFEKDPDNVVARAFWGRVPLRSATAGYVFRKGNKVQKLVHRLKYRDDQSLGEFMGRMLGQRLLEGGALHGVELLIPVPLHPRKLRKRGYNQSECIARGLSQALGLPLDTKSLVRASFTSTQTRKGRYARWENVSEAFRLRPGHPLKGKRVLLIDDVITTGATLEAAAMRLLEEGVEEVSVTAFASTLQ